jgi:hypothetical protein
MPAVRERKVLRRAATMKKFLRWIGLAIAISAYIALTIWANLSAGETAISQGESATRSGMQPFWALIYTGVAMFIGSWFVPKGGNRTGSERHVDLVNTPDLSQSKWRKLADEEKERGTRYLRDQALSVNLRMRKGEDRVEDSSDD